MKTQTVLASNGVLAKKYLMTLKSRNLASGRRARGAEQTIAVPHPDLKRVVAPGLDDVERPRLFEA
ncbi:hypothetical protein MYIN104542_00170 [Mycobacterium intermedium]